MRTILTILLAALAIFVGVQLSKNLYAPYKFNQASKLRKDAAISKLKDIRTAQKAYKDIYGRYSSSFDSLKLSMQNDSILIQKVIGDPNDTTVSIRRELIKTAITDTLFRDVSLITTMDDVPFSDNKKFYISAGQIMVSQIEVPVFESGIRFGDLYEGLDDQFFISDEKLKVGSMEEVSVNGNWE